jgi:uracil phosphoribosyltransferase
MELKKGKVVLKASDLDGFLTKEDRETLDVLDGKYAEILAACEALSGTRIVGEARERLISLYDEIGDSMQQVLTREPKIKVYSWETPKEIHGEVSRLVAKLRDVKTGRQEFIYYIQRAFELLFNLAFGGLSHKGRYHLLVPTPLQQPVQNVAVHKIPRITEDIKNCVMCVMLRGALLPSMIMSKEIQEYVAGGFVTPFALFKVSRNDEKTERDMEYILDLNRSYFDLESLEGKDLIFADPMNATGGSLYTIVRYLEMQKVEPRSILFFNVISAMKGSLRIARAMGKALIYTLWMDPVLDDKAYILPGLGDAGDRLNGQDTESEPRDIIQLIAAYGATITTLYRSQVRKIEETVLNPTH